MIIIVDLDLQQAVQGFGSKQPAPPIQVKSQDTPTLSIYFVKGNVNYDLGTSPGIRFGVFVDGDPNPLVEYITFTRILDAQSRVTYVGYPNFNTTQMQAAIGTLPQLECVAEIRYQTTFGTIARTADISIMVLRPLLSEAILDQLIAVFTVPAPGANNPARINNTSWLSAGLNITIGAGAGAYQVVSVTNVTDFLAENLGAPGNQVGGTVAIGTAVGITPPTLIDVYPDPSIIEIITRKNVASGYAGLDANRHIDPTVLPPTGGYELQVNKDATSGYAGLDAASHLKPAAFPLDNATLVFLAGLLQVPIDNVTLRIVSGKLTSLAGTGDMTKAVYDTANRGYVNRSVLADTATQATNATAAQSATTATRLTGTGAGVWTQDASNNQSFQPGGGQLTDAETSTGVSLIYNAAGVLRRLVQGANIQLQLDVPNGGITISATGAGAGVASLTDAPPGNVGQSIIENATGVLKRLVGSDTTIAIIDNGASTGTLGLAIALADANGVGNTLRGAANGQIKTLVAGTNVTLDPITTPGSVIINSQDAPQTGVQSLTDAITTPGATWINAASGVLKRIIAGSNVTLDPTTTPGGVIVNASLTGGGGMLDRTQGVELFDDFVADTSAGTLGWVLVQDAGSGATIVPFTNQTNTNPELGLFLFNSQSTGTTGMARYTLGPQSQGWTIGGTRRGALILEWRVAPQALETTANYADWKFGFLCNNSALTLMGAVFEYNVTSSPNWQCVTGDGTTVNTLNSGVAVAATYVKLQISIDAAWNSFAFLINGVTVATSTANLPGAAANSGFSPVILSGLRAGSSAVSMLLDWFYMHYSTTVIPR